MSGRRQLTKELYISMCSKVCTRPLALLAPAAVDNEERAFLTEVAISAMKELRDERLREEENERVELAEIAVSTRREMLEYLQAINQTKVHLPLPRARSQFQPLSH